MFVKDIKEIDQIIKKLQLDGNWLGVSETKQHTIKLYLQSDKRKLCHTLYSYSAKLVFSTDKCRFISVPEKLRVKNSSILIKILSTALFHQELHKHTHIHTRKDCKKL